MPSSKPWQTASALALWLVSACAHEVQELDLSHSIETEGEPDAGVPTSGSGGGSGFFGGGKGGVSGGKASAGSPSGGNGPSPNGKASGGQAGGGQASGGAGGMGGMGGMGTSGKGGSSAGAGTSGKAGAGGSGGGAPTHQACKAIKLPIDEGESSSVEDASLGPELAFDGVATTRWSSAHAEPQWLALDMGEDVRVARVLIRWENAYATDYQMAIADDADGPWRALFRERAGNGGTDDVADFDADAGRFVRFTGTTRATNFGFSIFELEVYGDVDEDCIAQ